MDVNTGKQRCFVFATDRVHAQNIVSSGALEGTPTEVDFYALVSADFLNYNQRESHPKKLTMALTDPGYLRRARRPTQKERGYQVISGHYPNKLRDN